MQFSVGGFQLLQGSIDTPDALTYRNKMRFLATGPNFPDDLLEARDAGNVVFFCGAGLSSPALPGVFRFSIATRRANRIFATSKWSGLRSLEAASYPGAGPPGFCTL